MDKTKQKCVLCGRRVATTKDHIPPKGIFPKPRPDDLITVPACLKCNNDASHDDEIFRVYLNSHVGMDKQRTKALWDQHTIRTIKHNRKLRKKLFGQVRPAYVKSYGGIIYGKKMVGFWDSAAHDSIIERTVRGLYYFHFDVILHAKSVIRVNWHRRLTNVMDMMTGDWNAHSIANGDFQYRYIRSEESPDESIWLFQFYSRHWASAQTNNIDRKLFCSLMP